MWTLFEPVHAVTYFAPEARSAFEAAGLRGFWRGYFAGRAAPLGPASAAVVTASFYNFAPAMVSRAVPGVWELMSPAKSLLTRQDGAIAALRRLLTGLEKDLIGPNGELTAAGQETHAAAEEATDRAAGPALCPAGAGRHAGTRRRSHPRRAGLRRRDSLPQPDRGACPRHRHLTR
jgi:hypothetical protein